MIMPLFFPLSSNDHFQEDFLNKLYIVSTFSNISLPFHGIHLIEVWSGTTLLNHEQLFHVNQNLLARALKHTFSLSFVFFLVLHLTTKEFLTFIKTIVHAFVISITRALFSVDSLANF